MKLLSTISFLLILTTSYAKADMLNYKNINSLAGIICQQVLKDKDSSFISKFSIDKTQLDKNEFKVQLIGTCNAEVKNGQITKFGEEIELSFYSNKETAKGRLGIKEIRIDLNSQGFSHVLIKDPLFNEAVKIKFTSSKWSSNNMIVTFEPIKLQFNGNKALEDTANLKLKDSTVYNLWNFEAYSCNNNLEQKDCSRLTSKL